MWSILHIQLVLVCYKYSAITFSILCWFSGITNFVGFKPVNSFAANFYLFINLRCISWKQTWIPNDKCNINRDSVGGTRRPIRTVPAAKCRKSGFPSLLHSGTWRTSHSRRREHVFICMFYPSAALNPTHPDRKVRSTARRARAVAASRSPPLPRSRTDSPAKLCPKSTGADADVRSVLIVTASGYRNRMRERSRAASRTTTASTATRILCTIRRRCTNVLTQKTKPKY